MKERPILFSSPMVRAILDGRKTQTRRIVKPQPEEKCHGSVLWWKGDELLMDSTYRCPYGTPGDRLWVQENHRLRCPIEETQSVECIYDADGEQQMVPLKLPEWCKMMVRSNQVVADYGAIIPGRFMYRSLSRITLEIEQVTIERLQDISPTEALREGVGHDSIGNPKVDFQNLWTRINGPGSWEANPWVWAITFHRITP